MQMEQTVKPTESTLVTFVKFAKFFYKPSKLFTYF